MGASWIPNRFQAALFTRPKAIESKSVLLFKVTIQNMIDLYNVTKPQSKKLFYVEYFALLIPIGTAIGPRASPKARQKA